MITWVDLWLVNLRWPLRHVGFFLLLILINYSTQWDNDFVFFFFFYVAGRWNPWSRVSHQRFKDKAFEQTKRGKLCVGVKSLKGFFVQFSRLRTYLLCKHNFSWCQFEQCLRKDGGGGLFPIQHLIWVNI